MKNSNQKFIAVLCTLSLFAVSVALNGTISKAETESESIVAETQKVVSFEYDGTNATAGNDMTEYAGTDSDYIYSATTGSGTMTASITGTELKHIEWGDSLDYGITVPILAAGKNNPWSADAYVAYQFSTTGYSGLTGSVQVGGTKKGPQNLVIGYYDNEVFQSLKTYSIAKNKTLYTVEFQLPDSLSNLSTVTIYVKLADTTNIGGNEMTDSAYNTGGELAINNFAVYGTLIALEESTTSGLDDALETTTSGLDDALETTTSGLDDALETTTSGNIEVAETTQSETVTTHKCISIKPAKVKYASKKITKKKTSNKVKVSLKKVKYADGYVIKISTSKKFSSKNTITKTVSKTTFTIKSKKLKNKKKLYIKARAYTSASDNSKTYGPWSNIKKITIKK
jgi:hypothetical protein